MSRDARDVLVGMKATVLHGNGNVSVEEDEPEVMFLANIHGDEFASGEIAYQWATELLDDYGVDLNRDGGMNWDGWGGSTTPSRSLR